MTDTATQIKAILAESNPDLRTDEKSIFGPMIDEAGAAMDHINNLVAIAATMAIADEALDLLEDFYSRKGERKVGEFLRRVAPERADRVEAQWDDLEDMV